MPFFCHKHKTPFFLKIGENWISFFSFPTTSTLFGPYIIWHPGGYKEGWNAILAFKLLMDCGEAIRPQPAKMASEGNPGGSQ